MEGRQKFLGRGGGWGGLKSQNLETKCEDRLEFIGGREALQNKKPSVARVWIFSRTAQFMQVFDRVYSGVQDSGISRVKNKMGV